MPSRFYIGLAILFCGVIGLYGVASVASPLLGGPWLGPKQWVWFPDFLTPYAAVRAFFDGKLALVYGNIDRFTEYQNALYRRPLPGRRLFPAVPLSAVLAAAAVAARPARGRAGDCGVHAGDGRRLGLRAGPASSWPWGWLAMATSPAAVHTVVSGQATFLAVALAYGGLRLLDRSPALAGILFGLLGYKPQFCLLIPVALIAARQWRALVWAAATGVVLVAASLAVFGAGRRGSTSSS